MKIRLCTEADIDAVNAIYNYEIENGVATFDSVIRSKDKAITWFNSHNTSNHPIFVAVDDNDKVLAYCSLSQYRDKDAFDTTVEISIYVDLLARRQGIARTLCNHIIAYATLERSDIHNIVSVITSSNEKSLNLFKSLNFKDGGTIPAVGIKFGQTLGITSLYLLV